MPIANWGDHLTTATFGPLEKYVAANDNVPGPGRGMYVGLRRSVADDPGYQEFERLANERGVQCADPSKALWAPENRGIPFDKLLAAHIDSRPASTDSGQPKRDWNAGLPRHGSFMQTATGRKFWPMDPKSDEVFIEDIAHSLSMQCRYAGHCMRFYSVAEHSVLIARHLAASHAPEVALWGLLHDASEAYLIDVPRPVKPYLTGYKAAEAAVMEVVCQRFGLAPFDMPPEVHEADERIIADELVNLVPMDWHARYDKPLGVRLRFWSPEQAREEFMATFEALVGRTGRVA